MKSVKLRITGRVQGVWYRAWTSERAAAFGLDGWVRNRSDGSVEALLSGEAAAVDAMVDACRLGPPAARVDGVEVSDAAPPDSPGFHKRPTA
jgi:acylphosphatase